MLTALAPHTPTPYLFASYLMFGFGIAMVAPPISDTAVAGMPPAQAGVAAAVASTSRHVGITLGVAAIGAIAGANLAGRIDTSFPEATHAGWWIIVELGTLILGLGLLTTGGWARETARRTGDALREP